MHAKDPNVEFGEAFFVREGYLMPRGWNTRGGGPPPTKRAKTGGPIKVLEEWYFRPLDSLRTITKAEIPHYGKQLCALHLRDYRKTADWVKAEVQKKAKGGKMKKSDVEGAGADLIDIWDRGGCHGGTFSSGSFLWGEECVW